MQEHIDQLISQKQDHIKQLEETKGRFKERHRCMMMNTGQMRDRVHYCNAKISVLREIIEYLKKQKRQTFKQVQHV